MKSRPRPELYQRFPAVIIPANASPGVVPIPIEALLPPPPLPPVILIVAIPTLEL